MRCRHCSDLLSLQMIDLGAAPPSNAFHASQNDPEQHYPLRVLVCTNCWLAQTDIDLFKLDYDELFTKDYPYFSSTSNGWVAHAKKYAETMVERFCLDEFTLTIEVGSNDGYLLQWMPTPCYGIEPTATGDLAKKRGIMSCDNFFTTAFAENAIHFKGKADLMVCNNVLAHVPNINDFVRGFWTLLKDNGVATFEFPWLMKLVQGKQFDTIYHEHYSYLSLVAVWEIFRTNGLEIFDVEELPTHGGSLRVYAQKAGGKRKVEDSVLNICGKETVVGMLDGRFYQGLQKSADRIKNDFMQFLLNAKSLGQSVVGFGAAAKGNTLLNYAGIRADLMSYVVDETPAKQGKFLPGSRIPVQKDFTTKPDYVVILPWNFKTEIMEKLSYIRGWGGKFVIAIPELEILS